MPPGHTSSHGANLGRARTRGTRSSGLAGRVQTHGGGRYSAGRNQAPARWPVSPPRPWSGGGGRPGRWIAAAGRVRTLRPRLGTASAGVRERAGRWDRWRGGMDPRRVCFCALSGLPSALARSVYGCFRAGPRIHASHRQHHRHASAPPSMRRFISMHGYSMRVLRVGREASAHPPGNISSSFGLPR